LSQSISSVDRAAELAHSSEALSVSEILKALGIHCENLAEERDSYFVIPGNNGPRWLIPAHSRASASLLSEWRPYRFSSQMKWFAIRMAARAGLLRHLRSVTSAAASRRGALRWFESCGIHSQAGEIVILAGNPSPDRKLAVFLIDDAHRIAAVLKVGVTAGGGLSVLHEAEVLRRLEPYCWAPKILSVHPDLRAAAQKYVHGVMAERRFRPEYLDLLCRMPRSGASRSLADVANKMANRLGPYKDELDKLIPDLLSRTLSLLDLDTAVPTMLAHGDFAPWNIRKNPEAGHVLIDWEWADFAGLPAYDLLHFQFNEDRLFGGKAGGYSAIRARPVCAEYFRRMEIDAQLLPRLAIAYLLSQLEAHCKGRGSGHTGYELRQLAAIVDAPGFVS
jgi:hypothetical protein